MVEAGKRSHRRWGDVKEKGRKFFPSGVKFGPWVTHTRHGGLHPFHRGIIRRCEPEIAERNSTQRQDFHSSSHSAEWGNSPILSHAALFSLETAYVLISFLALCSQYKIPLQLLDCTTLFCYSYLFWRVKHSNSELYAWPMFIVMDFRELWLAGIAAGSGCSVEMNDKYISILLFSPFLH